MKVANWIFTGQNGEDLSTMSGLLRNKFELYTEETKTV